MGKTNDFVVSAADFAFYVDDKLACKGTTNLNSSISVAMQEQDVNAGKGNKLVFTYKYGRELTATLETANWELSYVAANVGSSIVEGLSDIYKLNECVTLTAGIGTLVDTPIGKVSVELPNGAFIEVEPTAKTIDLTSQGLTTESVKVTYQYSEVVKTVTIDAESSPMVGKLILEADKHNNKKGKIGTVQVIIPSYALDGNFDISFTPDGVTSTNLAGKALAVEGDSCADGNAVYAYIKEVADASTSVAVSDIAATPSVVSLAVDGTKTISVLGLKGGLYRPVELENADCTFVSGTPATATVDTSGTITGVATGTSLITVTYNGIKDVIQVTVA